MSIALPAMANTESESWPEPVYFPQTESTPPSGTRPTSPPQHAKEKPTDNAPPKTASKGIWPFKRTAKQPPERIPSEEERLKVGPKDPPPSPYPLFRLGMSLNTGTGLLAPGIYLVKPAPPNPDNDPNNNQESPHGPTPTRNADERTIVLTRQGQTYLRCTLHAVKPPDENQEQYGTPSPLTQANPKIPDPAQVEGRLSADQRTMTLILKDNEQQFWSHPFPVVTDSRHVMPF